MQVTINVATVKKIGKAAGKIGKQVVIEGTQAVAMNTAGAFVGTALRKGLNEAKELTFDELIVGGKEAHKRQVEIEENFKKSRMARKEKKAAKKAEKAAKKADKVNKQLKVEVEVEAE